MRKQKGFALLELTVAAMLATLMAVWGAHALAVAMKDAAAQASAKWMLVVRDGARRYLERHGQVIREAADSSALAKAGYADWSSPALSELAADGLLASSLPLRTGSGAGATVRVLRHGACPGAACRLDAIVHSAQPFADRRSGRVDIQSVAQWLLASGGEGAWVSDRQPDMLRGATLTLRNPAWKGAALAPGTVALGIGQTAGGDYLRVRDQRDPDFQGTLTVKDRLTALGDIRINGQVQLQARAIANTPCRQEGSLAFQERAGLLVCLEGVWQPATPGVAGGYTHNSFSGCRGRNAVPNRYTGECACPSWSRPFQVSESPPTLLSFGVTRRYLCVN